MPLHLRDTYRYLVEFEGVEILGAEVRPGKDPGWTRVSDETAVPTRIDATLYIADPLLRLDMHINVDWAGRGTVREMTVLTGGPQTGVSISLLRRIPVDTLMRFAMQQTAIPVRLRPDLAPGAFQIEGQTDDFAWVSGGPLEPGRGKNTPGDRIVQVAKIFKDAQANGIRSPADVVAQVMHYSSATAARDIKEARRRGLLPPSRRKGSQQPAGTARLGTWRIARMPAEEFDTAARELGLQGPGPKGKRLSELTPDEFEELAVRLGAWERPADGAVEHPGVPLDEGTE